MAGPGAGLDHLRRGALGRRVRLRLAGARVAPGAVPARRAADGSRADRDRTGPRARSARRGDGRRTMTETGDGCGRGLLRILGMTMLATTLMAMLGHGAAPRARRTM